ncbi:M23 family metallopeptidase [Bacillus pinisoli]|uniref:M23 family metallopeptidase n=1 Tax=Bacillus pinisoli TaxID=2901866 RepID=UPI001FF2D5C2|nr:M23 family metallopeptidase [Bacillus pinisoli]
MSRSADEIRKRIAKRKKERQPTQSQSPRKGKGQPNFYVRDEERFGVAPFDTYEGGGGSNQHPLFQKEWFMFKILGAACLLLIIAIMFKDGSSRFDSARHFVNKAMESEFQFAAVTEWYEDQFGRPLALLPTTIDKETPAGNAPNYALPVLSTKILENFEKNGQGIMIETTGNNSQAEAIYEGTVEYIGTKPEVGGITVIIQHSDGTESWYGNLEKTDVLLYDYIEKGTKIGTVTNNSDGVNGMFYFAIKKGDSFIDPIQVINFE